MVPSARARIAGGKRLIPSGKSCGSTVNPGFRIDNQTFGLYLERPFFPANRAK
jgi:hypothetical protein